MGKPLAEDCPSVVVTARLTCEQAAWLDGQQGTRSDALRRLIEMARTADLAQCSLPDCKRKRYALGLCNLHWARLRRTGTTGPGLKAQWGAGAAWIREAIERAGDECIIDWPFGKCDGRPRLQFRDRRQENASHAVLIFAGYPQPPAPNNHALHSCDVPLCMNFRHLRWGSNADNARDRAERPRPRSGAVSAREVHLSSDVSKRPAVGKGQLRADRKDGGAGVAVRGKAADVGVGAARRGRVANAAGDAVRQNRGKRGVHDR